MRFIGIDVHRDFCEVAICEDGRVRSAGRVKTTAEELERFGESLGSDDRVALETTGNALRIARILERHVAAVLVADTRNVRAITQGQERPRRRPHAGARWRAGCCPASGSATSRRACCAGWCRGARSWCTSAPGRRTRSTPC